MPSKTKSLHFSPKNNSCYICGKSLDEFKTYFNFSSHQVEYETKTGIAGNEAEDQITYYYNQFVDYYSSQFFEFYELLMKLPDPIDNLNYLNIRSTQERQNLLTMFPELRDFDHQQLKKWGITTMSNISRGKGRKKKGERGNKGNIGAFKALCTEIFHDFKNKVVNREIIKIINRWYMDDDGYAVQKPAFLDPLNENLGKLKETKKQIIPEIVFSEREFSYNTRNQVSITYSYHLCPLCRFILKL